jgi:hypothetical protein
MLIRGGNQIVTILPVYHDVLRFHEDVRLRWYSVLIYNDCSLCIVLRSCPVIFSKVMERQMAVGFKCGSVVCLVHLLFSSKR